MNVVSKTAPTTAFKIEKGIPFPPVSIDTNRSVLYPFTEMAVGDSFAVNGGKEMQARLASAIAVHKKRYGRQFTIRRIDPNTFRVWRVA